MKAALLADHEPARPLPQYLPYLTLSLLVHALLLAWPSPLERAGRRSRRRA